MPRLTETYHEAANESSPYSLPNSAVSSRLLVRVSDLPGRHRLRSSSSQQLLVPPFRLTTVGRRSFPVAASLLWNSLPSVISQQTFHPLCTRAILVKFLHSEYIGKSSRSYAAQCMAKLRKSMKYESFTPESVDKIIAFRVPYFNVNAASMAVGSSSIRYLFCLLLKTNAATVSNRIVYSETALRMFRAWCNFSCFHSSSWGLGLNSTGLVSS